MDTPALEGILDEGTATKIGGAKSTWAEYRVACTGPGTGL